ncbi:hypothetical protein HZA40_00190 [Candidatus Peregrinibacteria bacterium]|nr:hypothetical protein [Candidatus Peregrinibacteria bacterium]
MCSNIVSKKFAFKNVVCGEQEYGKISEKYREKNPEDLMREFMEFSASVPKKYQNQINCENSSYLYSCFYTNDCFGCDGFHSKVKNCILNKQCSEVEYKNLVGKIIEHMKKTGEYGEFFPINLSLYGYNDSCAQDYRPLTREVAIKKGFNWKEKDPAQYRSMPKLTERNPEKLPDSVVKEIFACVHCGKNFQVLAQELKLFKKIKQLITGLGTPLSNLCGNCRFDELSKLKNPRKLWQRKCDKCGVGIESTYVPAVYTNGVSVMPKICCEKCYLETI